MTNDEVLALVKEVVSKHRLFSYWEIDVLGLTSRMIEHFRANPNIPIEGCLGDVACYLGMFRTGNPRNPQVLLPLTTAEKTYFVTRKYKPKELPILRTRWNLWWGVSSYGVPGHPVSFSRKREAVAAILEYDKFLLARAELHGLINNK